MEQVAYAKINLALHVRERLPDGYHRIETIFAFAEHGDVLRDYPAQDLVLELEGPFAAQLSADDNLVLKAARLLRQHTGATAGARLVLDKRLPVASGLGGGSADAAAAIHLLSRRWGAGLAMSWAELGAELGADVPACLLSRTCRGEGRGDTLGFASDVGVTGTPLLLVNPRVALSTASVFRAWDGVDRGPLGEWRDGRNDLEAAAVRLVPEIGEVLKVLRAQRAELSRMSGSGATCFALFSSDAQRDAAAAAIAAARPGWWQLSSRIR
jgi:4-diphosphocytidyl-2-C-methyl-D-erythritol kinase